MIKLDGVCFAYDGNVALRYVSIEVNKGECVAVHGPNGCGKSTLIRLLNGLIFPEEGSYVFDGDEITEKRLKEGSFAKAFHQKIGYVFQNPEAQLFSSTVYDEIAYGPLQMGLSEDEVKRRTEDILKLLEIEDLKERAPYHLSGGEKKKVAIGAVLSSNPKALILDEPLAGLDKKSQEWFVKLLLNMKSAGKTILISTHDEKLSEMVADRIIVMNDNHEVDYLWV